MAHYRKGNDKGIFLVISIILPILVGFMLISLTGVGGSNVCNEKNQHDCCITIHDKCSEKDSYGDPICDALVCNSEGCRINCLESEGVCMLVDNKGNAIYTEEDDINEAVAAANAEEDSVSCISLECHQSYRTCGINECESVIYRYDPTDPDQIMWRSVSVSNSGKASCCVITRDTITGEIMKRC